ncbi:MAG: hypothetical protein ACMVY4_12495 [Minwuia sp.]|uniref:hypothetical protein n=1 Tax=Minwuia sp. TaxID=2493630 RepID=UPI003A888F2C
MNRQKLRDAALLLPLMGLLLLMPPFVGLFRRSGEIAGVPSLVVYIFAVWAVLIGLGLLLSRKLATTDEPPPVNHPAAEDADDADR